jgi:acid phosphatase
MLLGDDLNDFTFAAGKTKDERDALVRRYADYWGVKWMILPNPVYGSWERAAMSDASGANDCEKKVNRLR